MARKSEQANPPSRRTVHERRPKLDTLADIKREMCSTYRAAINGKMAWSDASKAGHLLGLIAKLTESSEIEARIEALEAAAGSRANGHDDHDQRPVPRY